MSTALTPRCPYCGSENTELHALFGSMMLFSQYYCHGCRSIFDYVHDEEPPAEVARGDGP